MHQFKQFLNVSGNSREIGYQQGLLSGWSYQSMVDEIRHLDVIPKIFGHPLPGLAMHAALNAIGLRYWLLHRKEVNRFAGGDFGERLAGLAIGFKRQIHQLYAIQAIEILGSDIPYAMGCAAFALQPSQTALGEPVLAYNHDFPMAFRPYLRIRRANPSRGFETLSITYPPSVGAIAGINSAGLAITLNHAYARISRPRPAIPISILLQAALERCSTVQEALSFLIDPPVPNGSILTMVDKGGDRAVLELAPQTRKVRRQSVGWLVTFNKYVDPDMTQVELPLSAVGKGIFRNWEIHAQNTHREIRAREILRNGHRYTEADLFELLGDHGNQYGTLNSICRHSEMAHTLISALLMPGRGEMRVRFGNPCLEKTYIVRLGDGDSELDEARFMPQAS